MSALTNTKTTEGSVSPFLIQEPNASTSKPQFHQCCLHTYYCLLSRVDTITLVHVQVRVFHCAMVVSS